LVNPADFSWLSGEELLTYYPSEEGAGLQFCSRCGSTLCGVVQGEIHGVTLGCVTGDPGIALQRHIYVASKAPWETIPEGVPHYEEAAPGQMID
jgi:hypothetical protein